MTTPPKYYSQKESEYADCMPRALANAAVFFGIPHRVPDTTDWQELIVLAGCLHGSATLEVDELAPQFRLIAERVPVLEIRGKAPLIIDVWNPCVGTALHCVLVDQWWGDKVRTINYRTDGPKLVERLSVSYDPPPSWKRPPEAPPWKTIYIPDHPNDRAWLIKPRTPDVRT